jgi:hypothetical protein
MQRASRLDRTLYQEVRDDRAGGGSTWMVVLLSAAAQAIGATLGPQVRPRSGVAEVLGTAATTFVAVIVLWIAWSIVSSWLASRLFHATASSGQLLRPLGYAMSPGLVSLVRLPVALLASHAVSLIIGGLVLIAGSLWILATGVVATQVGCRLSLARALVVGVLGWLVASLVVFLIVFGLGVVTG